MNNYIALTQNNTYGADEMVLVGYPGAYKVTTARNHFAYVSNGRAYAKLDAANKVDAMEIIRHNFPGCVIIDKAVA